LRAGTAREAVHLLVAEAFGDEQHGAHLRETIERCDFRGEKTRLAASAMHLSRRQFFRHRAEALNRLNSTLARVLERPPTADHDVVFAGAVSAVDTEAAFHLYADIVRRRSGEQREAVRVAATLSAVWSANDPSAVAPEASGSTDPLAKVEQAAFLSLTGATEIASRLYAEAAKQLSGRRQIAHRQAAFRLACYELAACRQEGDLKRAQMLVGQLAALADDDRRLHAIARAEEAQHACRLGDMSKAAALIADAEKLSLADPEALVAARIGHAKATLAFMQGQHAAALRYAVGATSIFAVGQPLYAFSAAALAGRAALALGLSWNCADGLCARFPNAPQRADIEAVRARHLLFVDSNAAQAAAERALELARQHRLSNSIIFAQATLSLVAQAQHRNAEARSLRSLAWQRAVAAGDRLLLQDLFPDFGFSEQLHDHKSA